MSNLETMGDLPTPPDHIAGLRPRRERRSQFSMFQKKLDLVFLDPDFFQKWKPYWFNDEGQGARIQQAMDDGYEFIMKDEVAGGVSDGVTPINNDPGSRVRRYVGPGADGPLYAYAMKKPMEFVIEDESEREAYHQNIEDAIRAGTLNRQASDGQYSAKDNPRGGTSIPPITVRQANFAFSPPKSQSR